MIHRGRLKIVIPLLLPMITAVHRKGDVARPGEVLTEPNKPVTVKLRASAGSDNNSYARFTAGRCPQRTMQGYTVTGFQFDKLALDVRLSKGACTSRGDEH